MTQVFDSETSAPKISSRKPWWTSLSFAAIAFIIVWMLSLSVLLLSPVGKPALVIGVQSSEPGFSQLFFADEENDFAEDRSRWAPVSVGSNTLSFSLNPLRGTVGNYLRWDPLDRPGEMSVTGIELRSAFVHESIDVSALRPSMGMSEIFLEGETANFSLQSNDPQALLTADIDAFFSAYVRSSVLISTLLALAAAIVVLLITRVFPSVHVRSNATSSVSSGQPDGIRLVSIPSWALAIFGALTAIGLVVLFWGSRAIGISWDEPTHESSLGEFFRSGLYAPRWSFVDGAPSQVAASVYAPFADLFGHAIGAAAGAHEWFSESYLSDSYMWRHFAVALLSVLGLGAVALIARLLFASWKWSAVATAVWFAVPLLVGHSMFNVKDAPVAAGFTIFTLGLVNLITRYTARVPALASLATLAVGLLISIGSRPGIWVALFFSVVVTFLLVFAIGIRSAGLRQSLVSLVQQTVVVIGACLLALFGLWMMYPFAFSNVPGLLVGSLETSQAFPWSGETLTAGIEMPAQPPWTYIPLWLGAQLPMVILITAVLGLMWSLVSYGRSFARGLPAPVITMGAIPIALQALSVPVGAVVTQATLYGGVRQILFVFPAVALLSVIGIRALSVLIGRLGKSWIVSLAWGVVVVGLVVPIVGQIRLFPYSFAYFNAGAAIGSIDRNWDVDGWWLSGRELVEGQQFPPRTFCVDSPARPISDCTRMEMITPYLSPFDESDLSLAEDQYVALSRFPDTIGPDKCAPIRQVTRGLFWQEIQLSQASVCTVALAPYPEGGLNLSGLAKDDPVVLWGWNPYLLWGWGEPDADGVWMVDNQASVGFTQDLDPASPVEMVLTGSGSVLGAEGATVRVFVNGVESGSFAVPEPESIEQISVPVPSEAFVGDRLLVRFEVEGLDADRIDEAITGGELGIWRLDRLDIS